jgi:hypothetical protein
VQSQTTTEIFLAPQSYTAQKLDEIFNINVNIRNVEQSQRMTVAQFRIQYNNTLLEALKVTEGSFLQQFHNAESAPYTFSVSYIENKTQDPLYGPDVLVGIVLLPNSTGHWTNYPQGNGTLATITFKTIYRPVEPSPPAACLLNLTDTMLVDEDINDIPHLATSATYYAQPLPLPKMTIQPSDYKATLLGEIFNVSVNLENVDADWRMIVAQFRIQYNNTLLEALKVTEGSFLQQFHNAESAPYTFSVSYIENKTQDPLYGPDVLVGIVLLPNSTGHWTNFPHGNGTLATVTFKSTYQPNWQEPSITADLILSDTILVNDTVEEIPHTVANGLYEIQPPTFSYKPTAPSAGEVTIFKVAEPQNHAPLTYNWDFGDGTTMNTNASTVAHAFPSGKYNVTLTVIMNNTEATAVEAVTVGFYMPLGVTAEVGSLHFKGETAEFTILTTDSGKPINATSLEAKLYFNGTLINNLSGAIGYVDTGFYRIPYYIPANALLGEYTLLVKAEYYGANGAAMAKFTISPTLTAWNDSIAQITEIQNGVATVSNGITNIKLNLTAINATVTGLITSGKGEILAKIDTSVGTLTTRLDAINATITEVKGNTVTISTALGEVKTTLSDTQSTATTTLYVASILSAIAVILAVIILLILRKK